MLTDAEGVEIRRLAYAAFGKGVENSGSGEAPQYSYTCLRADMHRKERDRSGLLYYGGSDFDHTSMHEKIMRLPFS